ncbi:MAG TPA: N-acetyltransferase [Methylomirabilota bacterium]|nr:N-acetyltransferase [Methylomirabilota bacterium]
MGISESASIRIERVTNRKALKTFVGLPAPLYRDDPAWVAPLMFERLNLLAKDKNPYFEHAAADYWIAYRDGEPVGRISAQIDELAQDGHGQGTGHFGFVEAPDDPTVFRALFETAEGWLQDRGMVRVLGPFNLSINEECGLLIDGFKDRPRIMMSHARPYYAARIEGLGYRKAKDLWAYDLDAVAELPENVLRIVRKAEADQRLQVRNLRRSRMSDDFRIIRDIFNDAWSNNWGYVPLTEAEISKMRADLSLLLYEHSGKIAYWEGEPAAFMLVLPDLNELIADLHGRLVPFGWAKLAWRVRRRRFPCVRVPLMGVRKRYQNRPSGAFMALLLIAQHRVEWRRRHGMLRGELSWILEDNESMKGIADSIVGVHYKTYRIYEKALR